MKKFILLGELGEKFGREHNFDVKTINEGMRALRANFKDFESYMIKSSDRGVGYKVAVNKKHLTKDEELLYPLGKQNDIIVAPAIFGSSADLKIFAGLALIVVGAALSEYVVGAPIFAFGVALLAGGVMQLLSPVPNLKEPHENDDSKPSYYFTGPVNTAAVGEPVPVGYGRMIVGSAVISAGVSVEELDE